MSTRAVLDDCCRLVSKPGDPKATGQGHSGGDTEQEDTVRVLDKNAARSFAEKVVLRDV